MSFLRTLKSRLLFVNTSMKYVCFCIVVFLGNHDLFGQLPGEYQLKAVFLYNFSHFVSWPEDSFKDADSPFVIGILGENVFENHLEATVDGEKVDGHPIVVKYFKTPEEIGSCHILFISRSYSSSLHKIIPALKNRQTLTIGDADNFTKSKGMIRFYNSDNKVRLEINPQAIDAAGLEVSSKLLNLATLYKK
jgi:preprotein translocase subunit Sec61beta